MKTVYQKVVLIDDETIQNKIHQRLIRHYLGSHPIEIVSFTDPIQALLHLENANGNHIRTLVLLDLCMPYMDGWEFLDHLDYVDMDNTFIYIVSSSSHEAVAERADNHPKVAGYTKKPLSSAGNGLLIGTLAALANGQ